MHTNAMKAKIAMGRKQLGLDDDTYRAMLAEVAGHTSTKDCSDAQLARVIDHLASKGAVFASAKGKTQDAGKYKARAAQRRSDFYEIPDGPHAAQKRKLCAMWKELGYDMISLDTRVRRQCGIDAFRWCDEPDFLQTLGRDLEKRLKRKREKAAIAAREAEQTGLCPVPRFPKEAAIAAREAEQTGLCPVPRFPKAAKARV